MHTTALSVLAAPLLLAARTQVKVTMRLYQDNNCQTLIPGTGNTTVNDQTCDTNVRTGWSSAHIIYGNYGTLTFYSRNNCAAIQPSHGYDASNYDCLNNFGFVANAVGFAYKYPSISGQSGMERLLCLNGRHVADYGYSISLTVIGSYNSYSATLFPQAVIVEGGFIHFNGFIASGCLIIANIAI
ncbi:hypothetical protein RRF57_005589 [Xylaria bambusicola]|uniref:Uncharacterized protein n=1 Tax=Xylaria bambusicola TaxID=326684 RepID=A0AAN7UMG6_9PEZI